MIGERAGRLTRDRRRGDHALEKFAAIGARHDRPTLSFDVRRSRQPRARSLRNVFAVRGGFAEDLMTHRVSLQRRAIEIDAKAGPFGDDGVGGIEAERLAEQTVLADHSYANVGRPRATFCRLHLKETPDPLTTH